MSSDPADKDFNPIISPETLRSLQESLLGEKPEPVSIAERVVSRIDEAYAKETSDAPRAYLGASSIGAKCDAALGFGLRGFPDNGTEPKLKRIFRDGHRIENDVIRDLRKAGFTVLDRDEVTGRQWRFEHAGGHIVGHADGIIELDDGGPTCLLEIKSMNNKLWNDFKKMGVKHSHPKYWDQMQMMMGLSGITRCLFISYNKDNSLYHAEMVAFDYMDWSYIQGRIEDVWENRSKKISSDPESFACRFCFKSDACWHGLQPEVRCRTCEFSAPEEKGGWWCRLHKTQCDDPCGDWVAWKPMEKGS